MTTVKEQVAEVEALVQKNHGFDAHLKYNFVHEGWVKDWLKTNNPEETARLYAERCNSFQRGEIAQFQARHAPMSAAGAKAYADNWN
jgi:hypothetical protein